MIRSGCFSVLLSAIAVSLVADDAADREARIAWLNQHAIALRSIDPADEDFADLEPLRKAIGEAGSSNSASRATATARRSTPRPG